MASTPRVGRVRVRDAVVFGRETFRTLLASEGFTMSLATGGVIARRGEFEEFIPDSNIVQRCSLDAVKLWSNE